MNWDQDKLHTIIRELINIEQYNSNVSRSTEKLNVKWSHMSAVVNIAKLLINFLKLYLYLLCDTK
jgi:hypothetical protein